MASNANTNIDQKSGTAMQFMKTGAISKYGIRKHAYAQKILLEIKNVCQAGVPSKPLSHENFQHNYVFLQHIFILTCIYQVATS